MIKLRKIEPDDLPFLYQWENDSRAWADGANHNPLSQQDLRDYIQSTTGDIYRDGQLRLIIESNSPQDGLSAERSVSEAVLLWVVSIFLTLMHVIAGPLSVCILRPNGAEKE